MSIIADKPTTLSSDKIETIEKEVSGARNILSQPFFRSQPNTMGILGTFCYVLYKQPTNIFH